MRAIPECGIKLIQGFEEDILRVYDDRQPKVILTTGTRILGVLTAGYGHTGSDVTVGLTVTQQMADDWFTRDSVNKVITPIYDKIGEVVDELTDNQYGALCSFVYNLGVGDPKKTEWTIWTRLRNKQFDQVPQEIAKFVNWNGQKSLGLVRRRAAEQVLWATDEPGTEDTNPPSTVTRQDPTPPTPSDPTPVLQSKAILTGVAGAIAAGPPLVNQAIQSIQPYADHSTFAGHLLGTLSMIGAVLAVAAVVFTFLLKREARN